MLASARQAEKDMGRVSSNNVHKAVTSNTRFNSDMQEIIKNIITARKVLKNDNSEHMRSELRL